MERAWLRNGTLPFWERRSRSFSLCSAIPSAWLKRWSFWTSVAICLSLHLIGIGIFFEYGLMNVSRLAWGRWLPLAAVEAVALLVVVKQIEEKLTGNCFS